MAVTYEQVRQLALALPDVTDGQAYGGPSLPVERKFLGRLRENGETVVLKVAPAERERLLADAPDAFFLTAHYRDHPLVLVNLLAAERGCLARLIEQAWRALAAKRVVAADDARLTAHRTEGGPPSRQQAGVSLRDAPRGERPQRRGC